jgi:hypothetical protein
MNADIYTMKRTGDDIHRVTNFQSMSWAPFYHSSERYVIFTSNKLGFENFELFIVDADGEREPVRVTYTDGFDGLPVFSPDGRKLCWTSNRTSDGKSQLFMADWDHEAAWAALSTAPLRTVPPNENGKTAVERRPIGRGVEWSFADAKADISKDDLRGFVEWLAHGDREGRATGSQGARASAVWAAKYFESIGLKPLGADFYFPFEFRAGEKLIAEKNELTFAIRSAKDAPEITRRWSLDEDFRPLAFSENGEVEGDVVFAGYGLSVPEGNGQMRYNSYDGLDVKDKVVLLFRYVPEEVEPARRAHLNRYSGLRYKIMMARERGAKGVLVVTGPNSPNAGELLPLSNDGSHADSGVPALSISGETAQALLAGSGKSLKDLQTALDQENPHAEGGFVIPNVRVKFTTAIEHIRKEDRNVVAALPGTTDEWVLVGAHYDHLGRGGSGSMAKSGEENQIHYGADDNASGTAVVMEIAGALAKESEQLRRGILFALWSGEEIGLIGSSDFASRPPVPVEKIAAYINFDMVGRLRDNKLSMQAVGSSKLWRKLLEKRNVAAGFNLALQDDPYLPTDVTAFYPKRIPVLNFFTGSHEDYHRPADTVEKLNLEGMERIARFAQLIVKDVADAPERPDYSRVERSDQGGGSRETLRAYLGTIPDYTQEAKGVKLSGVRGGSPAEKGGLQGGDLIVEFAGQKIANIYDYTYALDAVKIGRPVKISVEREGKRVEVTVTPEARK